MSKSESETRKIAANLAKKIISQKTRDKAAVIALEGELGAGKTVFVRGFARALGIKKRITSPTFVIMKSYNISIACHKQLIHIDSYRLKDYRDLEQIGVKEIINNPSNIILIEWSDRVSEILPKKYIKTHIDHINKTTRKIIIDF